MASVPSPSSPPASPSSASSSDNSATEPIPHSPPNPQVDAGVNNGVLNVDEKKPDISAYFDDLHSANHIEKFKKYEADYSRWLTAKYFSKKNLYGGNIFDEDMTIQDEIMSKVTLVELARPSPTLPEILSGTGSSLVGVDRTMKELLQDLTFGDGGVQARMEGIMFQRLEGTSQANPIFSLLKDYLSSL